MEILVKYVAKLMILFRRIFSREYNTTYKLLISKVFQCVMSIREFACIPIWKLILFMCSWNYKIR